MVKQDEHQILLFIKYAPPFVVLIASFLITLLLYFDYQKTLEIEKQQIQEEFISAQKKQIKQLVHTAHGFIEDTALKTERHLKESLQRKVRNAKVIAHSIYNKNKATKSKEEITELIKTALREIRFNGGRGYIFIHQMDGVNILHPILPQREGVNISRRKDKNGIQRFQVVKDIIEKDKKGFATFHFFYPPEPTKQRKKIVYVEHFEPFNWMFGTGEYLEDFEKNVQKNVLNHLAQLQLPNKRSYVILTHDGTFLNHWKKAMIGKNIYKNKELQKLQPLFKEVQNILPNKEGYYTNKLSINPKTKEASPKLFFIKSFNEWKWFITLGFYIDDANQAIDKKKEYLEAKYQDYLHTMIIVSLFSTFILLVVSFYMAQLLGKKFLNYKKQLEEEVADNIKQKDNLQKAQEFAKIGDWELDVATMKATWSKQVFKIFDQEEQKEVGPDFLKKLMHEDDWDEFMFSMEQCIQENKEHRVIYRIYKPNGEIRWIDCRGHFEKDRNTITGIIQDITDNKILEIEKHQQEELLYQQTKMAAMGEMLGNIAHQWRQPLSTISTASTGMKIQKELGVLTDTEFYTSMDAINKSAQYLSQTIEDFRNFYKPNKNITTFSLKTTIEKTLSLIQARCVEENIQVIDNTPPISIQSLENELVQVLINVLNNARDALIEKCEGTRLIFIEINQDDTHTNIIIYDNAKGVPEAIIPRIFEPYFTTKHQSQGTGIGLYMCQEIVSKHLQGTLHVRNKTFRYDGESYTGAQFEISVPNKIEEKEAK